MKRWISWLVCRYVRGASERCFADAVKVSDSRHLVILNSEELNTLVEKRKERFIRTVLKPISEVRWDFPWEKLVSVEPMQEAEDT